ncbi:MAG: alpha-ketoacid dehydrogenase subunit beta [Actinobacteria bacterium]|nr:alpha-ketoacid dehydrogenase subunit beta [Actinomycetota bacterium]
MRKITYAEAINEAIEEEMKRDPKVFCLGEDIGPHGGAFQVTRGLFDIFGQDRIINTPISELGFTGLAVGAAMKGLRPIVEYMYIDFTLLAMDQIINQAAKLRYMTGGKVQIPIVFRTQGGAGRSNAGQHSQSLEALFYHIPGLKVIMPSSPYDAKGLLKAAIRDNNPVVFIEHKLLYTKEGEVPEEDYIVPIGKSEIKRGGTDLTVAAYSNMVFKTLAVAEKLMGKIDIEVIDLRTLVPLDVETIIKSVKKTNKLVIVQEAVRRGGVASDISSQVVEKIFDYLDSPVKIIAGENTIIPYSHSLESLAIPSEELIEKEIMEFLELK